MDIWDFLLIFSGIIFVISVFKESNKKYSPLRIKEAERYFNGSVVKKGESLDDSRTRSIGLAFVKDKKTGKYKFVKQSKLAGDTLLRD